ncbi:hypothetical protein ACHAWU_009040 [Discostella pseudostelligera]|uniref:CUE domain-containing protein n=1 Tax=Discostella pseudostelligera TaxID=259834 RepID=A0ABD3MCN1_9STRA
MIPTTSSSPSSLNSSAISTLVDMVGKSYIESDSSWSDILEGTQSLCGIYMSSMNACRCCCYFTSDSSDEEEMYHELILAVVSLAWVHNYLLLSNKKLGDDTLNDEDEMQRIILRTLSRMLKYGLVNSFGKSEVDMEEQLSSIMTVIQNIQSAVGEEDCTLGDMLHLDEDKLGEESFISAICSKFEANDSSQPPQLQYLLDMLKSFPKSKTLQTKVDTSTSTMQSAEFNATSLEPQEPTSLTDIQIAHVKSILPSLGDGFIEEALKCYSHDVERTVEALLILSDEESNATTHTAADIHPRLLTIPRNLPRKLREGVDHYSANVNMHRGATMTKEDGKEHARIQKEYLKRVEQKAEEDAYFMDSVMRMENATKTQDDMQDVRHNFDDNVTTTRDEYDDDYDDQYDGIGDDGGMAGGIGGLDEGLYDMDIHNIHQRQESSIGRVKNEQDMWRKYNTLVREEEAESRYWQDNQNLNRTTEEGGDGNAAKYRGPDKGRGGRLIGPDGKYLPVNRGGKKGRGTASAGGGGNAGRGAGAGDKSGGRGRGGHGATSKADTNASNSQGNKADELSKLQKRRKNDNKAKIGNHHRKDRATKKAAGIVPQG